MTLARNAILATLVALLASACMPAPESASSAAAAIDVPPVVASPAADDADLDRARSAAMAFSGRLRGTLQAAMAEGGPVAAIDVCGTDAPRIADAVMAEHGVRLGRVAMPGRNRNPAQAAGDWQLATLEHFQQAVAAGALAAEQVAVVRDGLADGIALRMMRGIATEPGCLACHGTQVAPDIRDAIAQRYADDGATGFEVGDLRGALWVEVPTTHAATPAGGSP